ncbi:hypothetical protein B6V76_11220 [Thioclava sp. IC9]|nr:hypothetical protein B6V76_11220 [Thioclava sp. IC9]|tara:strand:+ start:707 stop:955 length:249 start_codon:yes stop_codon:yes gene_type:complete
MVGPVRPLFKHGRTSRGHDVQPLGAALADLVHLKCRAAEDSLKEAGERLFTFSRLDPSQWKSAKTANAIKRLNEEFRRRIKT